MRKSLKITLLVLGLGLLVFVGRPAVFLAGVWLRDGSNARTMPAAGWNDASRLSEGKPAEVILVAADPGEAESQLRDLVRRASREGKHISISGAQHSMGGHTIGTDGIVLDMRRFATMSLNEQTQILTVGAGARWFQIIPYLDQRGYAVSIMQTNNDFSVGGSLSVNCHGWQNDMAPIASTVESFRILTATGDVVRCSRSENRELFSLALGGYGLFGVLLEVELRVVPNDHYEAEAHFMAPEDYVRSYHEFTRGKKDVGMAYGRISVAPDSFFREASVTLLRRRATDQSAKNTLVDAVPNALKRAVFLGGVGSDYGKNLRWTVERLFGETGGKVLSRNQIMNEPSIVYATRDDTTTDILHEYFIPARRFADFIAKARPVFFHHKHELLNVTVRNVKPDQDSFLRYAPEEMFGLVLLFNQKRDEAAEIAMRDLTRELIDVALSCEGRYYLPYRPHATPRQFLQAYPQAPEFFRLKRRYDPAGVFENKFYINYGKSLGSD